MSGPITAGYCIVQGVLMLSMHALREARALKREYGEILDRLRRREEAIEQTRQGQRTARLERLTALRLQTERQLARLQRLRSVAQAMAVDAPEVSRLLEISVPTAPIADDGTATEASLSKLNAAVTNLEAALLRAGARFGGQVRAALGAIGPAASLDDVLAAYALRRQLQPGLDPAQTALFRETARRILARIESPPGAPLPQELEALAREIVLAPSVERAEALASELRLAVQRERKDREARQSEIVDALRLLEALADDAPPPLLRALERVAAGGEPLDPALRAAAQQVLSDIRGTKQRREEEAAAQVLQQSLRDLGYEVADIEATLFVDGGAVHFQRQGWESYFVCMRVDPIGHSLNFNVVRARGAEDTAERKRLDALAEDRWCAEVPRVLETLASRGLRLDVTRRLGAGEVPVQVVDAGSLPRVADQDQGLRAGKTARTRGLPQ